MTVYRDQQFAADTAALQESFLSAPFSATGWTDALRLLASTTRSSRAQLIGVGTATTRFNVMTDIDPSYQDDFIAIEGHRQDVNWRIAATGRPMEVISERHYDDARKLMRSEAYDEHCRRWGGESGCQTTLMQGDAFLVGLATLRGEAEGRTSERDRQIFAAGAASALAAVRMQQAMADRGTAMMAGSFDAIGIAACFADANGRIAALSALAEAQVGPGGPFRMRRGRLAAVGAECNQRLQTALATALYGGATGQQQRLWIGPIGGRTGALCELFRLPVREWDFGFDPRVLIVIRSATDIPAAKLAPLREALGLTGAEAEIALALSNGACRDQIAADRHTSAATLKSQIKSVLRKADVDREAGLVALINRLMR